jgi:hypothetical protein
MERFFVQMGRFFDQVDPNTIIAIAIGLVCLALFIALVFMTLQIIGTGGLIGGVQTADSSGQVTFGQAWGVGTKYFWRLFLLSLLVGVAILAVMLVLIAPGVLIAVGTMRVGIICLIPLICALALVAIALSILQHFARFAIVLEDKGVIDSLKRAWEILKANIGPIVLLGLILLVVSGVAGFVMALPLLLVILPAIVGVAGLLIQGGQVLGTASLVAAGLCCVAWAPVMYVLNGVLQTWTTATWTLAYKQFMAKAGSPPAAAPLPPAV